MSTAAVDAAMDTAIAAANGTAGPPLRATATAMVTADINAKKGMVAWYP